MGGFESVMRVVPTALQDILRKVPLNICSQVQEIRLRKDAPLILSIRGKQWYLTPHGEIDSICEKGILCSGEWVEKTFDMACDQSVYTHQEELRQGYVTTGDGCRIGIGGTAVVRGGKVESFRNIQSLCIRVAHDHPACAAELIRIVYDNQTLHSALICGEPSSGKTSLLRDLMAQLEQRRISVSVIDERGELTRNGTIKIGDALLYTPKAIGMEMAVRTLSPQVIVFDELGNDEEIQAVMDSVYRGVTVIATIHGSPRDLMRRRALYQALEQGAFEQVIFLEGRELPGQIREWHKTEEWLREMDRGYLIANNRNRNRAGGVDEIATTSKGIATIYSAFEPIGRESSLYRGTRI